MNRLQYHRAILLTAACCAILATGAARATAAGPPNILWLSCEDISPHLGCYGDERAITPHLDRFATEGVRYTHAFTTAGVCAPCRSGIITGMYQTTLGTHHMRTVAKLPDFVQPFPALLRKAGYYCTNNSKQDYQFRTPQGTWDESSGKAHWRNRGRPEQPFFAVFNFTGCHESGIAGTNKYRQVTKNLTPDQRQDPALLTLPPYYPDTPVVREDWKRNYELITAMDAWAGGLLAQLEEDGLAENTIVFYWSDHGVGLPRAKRWLYDSGTRIPLIVRIPSAYRTGEQGRPGTVSNRLVSSIDFGPTVLRLAGVELPGHLQGQPFLGDSLPPARDYVYGARDRMDERYDVIRMVRNHRFKYLRNYEPLKTWYQYMNTPEKGATMRELRRLHEAGELPPAAEQYFAANKPVEELYDTTADPHELHNLADDPQHAEVLAKLRKAHLAWVRDTRDLGLVPEPILVEREQQLGARYHILRKAPDGLADRLAATAVLASAGKSALPELTEALTDADAAIRYWAAVGIGNVASADGNAGLNEQQAARAQTAIRPLLADDSPAVRVQAARAMCRLRDPAAALPVLLQVLHEGQQWERLQAAIVLDEIDEQARPVTADLHRGLKPRPDLYARGKYVVRVLNRALNQLEGTSRTVP